MQDSCQKFFSQWEKFFNEWRSCRAAVAREREQDEREKKMNAAAGSRKPATAAVGNESLFEMYSKSQQGCANEIVTKFRSRHQQTGSGAPGTGTTAAAHPASQRKKSAELTSELAVKLANRRNQGAR